MWAIHQTISVLRYFVTAQTPAHIHSPYLFDLLRFIFDESRQYYAFEHLEAERDALLMDTSPIARHDLGAGSRKGTGAYRVCDIARTALSSRVKCAAYFRLTAFHQPQQIIEVGTSLGISTAYIAAAHRDGQVSALEGSATLLSHAKSISNSLSLKNILFIEGQFNNTLPATLEKMGAFDLAFIDGNHRLLPTLDYFDQLKKYSCPQSIIVVDDIRWSREMYNAWQKMIQDDQVTATVDLFSFGLVFFRPEFRQKLNLQVIPRRRPGSVILK